MAFQITWEIEGERQLSRRLRKVVSGVSNFKKPFQESADHLAKIYSKDVFSTRGSVINERWKRLSPATVAAKARSGFGSAPLVNTGAMRSSFRTLVTTDSARIGNTSDYFKYHQSNKPRRKIPRRVMMKIAAAQREDIVRIFHLFLRGAMKK